MSTHIRGIFTLPVLRKILDRLVYNDLYKTIDESMSDSNVGARKEHNIRNHLFIIHGIINSVNKGKEDCIDLQVYNLVQAFDSLWAEDVMNDLYDAIGDNEVDDKVALLFKANETNLVAVKTPVGETERINIERIIQQGGTWGPIQCSNSIDQIIKQYMWSQFSIFLLY